MHERNEKWGRCVLCPEDPDDWAAYPLSLCLLHRTKVVNLRREPFDVYIGRAGKGQDGHFGNPFRLGPSESRGATLGRYEMWLPAWAGEDPEFRRRLLLLQGKVLGCFCKPLPCHGDIIARFVDREFVEGLKSSGKI